MLRPLLFAAASLVVLGACASAPDTSSSTPSGASEVTADSPFKLAMRTADELVAAGNTPTAIQRLMQIVGDTSLTATEKSDTLYQLGKLSASPTGYNAEGAVDYFKEVLASQASAATAKSAASALPLAEAAVAKYLATVNSLDANRSDQFLALFNLGRHQEAIDLMVANDILPGNEPLLAMYQIGYLCDDPNLTGRAYAVTDRDKTVRNLRFCDFGK